MQSLNWLLALGIFLSVFNIYPASAAPVAPQDDAAVRALVQRTWAPFGTTGVPRGPIYNPPRTAELAALIARCDKLNREHDSDVCATDNPYCLCWNEYHPHAGGLRVVGVNPNTIDARVSILLDNNPESQTRVMRFVRSPGGWLLDDIFHADRRGTKENASLKEALKWSIAEMMR